MFDAVFRFLGHLGHRHCPAPWLPKFHFRKENQKGQIREDLEEFLGLCGGPASVFVQNCF